MAQPDKNSNNKQAECIKCRFKVAPAARQRCALHRGALCWQVLRCRSLVDWRASETCPGQWEQEQLACPLDLGPHCNRYAC